MLVSFLKTAMLYFAICLAIALFCASYINDRLVGEGAFSTDDRKARFKTNITATKVSAIIGLICGLLGLIEDLNVAGLVATFSAIVFVTATIHNVFNHDNDNPEKIIVQTKRFLYHAIFWASSIGLGGALGEAGPAIVVAIGLPIAVLIGGMERMDDNGGCLIVVAFILMFIFIAGFITG